jgi:hypothetical protein
MDFFLRKKSAMSSMSAANSEGQPGQKQCSEGPPGQEKQEEATESDNKGGSKRE